MIADKSRRKRPVMATFPVRGSRGAPVVVVEPTEYGNRLDAALHLRRSRHRLLLGQSLVRARLIVEARELGDEPSQGRLAEDENVVEQLASQCAGEAFGEGVHVRRMDRRADHARVDGGEGDGAAIDAPPETTSADSGSIADSGTRDAPACSTGDAACNALKACGPVVTLVDATTLAPQPGGGRSRMVPTC
jgi:hypothetical protein